MRSYFIRPMGFGKRNGGSAVSYAKRRALLYCSDARIKEVVVTDA
jgi:hypothetical protein